jgi:hypothetical protein
MYPTYSSVRPSHRLSLESFRRLSARESGAEAWVQDPGLVFYPGARGLARPPETLQSRSGHVSCGTFSATVARGDPPLTVRAARVRR